MDIVKSPWSAEAIHFVIEDSHHPLFFDAYVIDLGTEAHPNVQCVILFASDSGLPRYLYAGECLEGVPHERVLRDAMRAYQDRFRVEIDEIERSERDYGPLP